LSKIESGRFELEQVPFEVRDLVEKTAEMIAPRAQLKGVGLYARVAAESPFSLIGDPVRLQQILINLLGNAVKFTACGEIVLTVGPHPGGDSGRLQFKVTDTGIGIPADKLGAIFEDFTQAESSTTRRFGGTGLGLGIARRLVKCMGGDLTVSSILGQGSTFSFDAVFPVNERRPPVESLQNAKDPGGAPSRGAEIPAKILVAEDSDDNRFLLQAYLRKEPYQLIFVGNGQEALSTFKKEAFDLVLMDIHMPIMDGLMATDLIRAFERQNARARTPILALTADALTGDAELSQAAGCDGHLSKPISKQDLVTAIEGFRMLQHA
jgi:CheY-like chemotaxis protein